MSKPLALRKRHAPDYIPMGEKPKPGYIYFQLDTRKACYSPRYRIRRVAASHVEITVHGFYGEEVLTITTQNEGAQRLASAINGFFAQEEINSVQVKSPRRKA